MNDTSFPTPFEDNTEHLEIPQTEVVDRSLPVTKDDLIKNLTNTLSYRPETYSNYCQALLKRNVSGTKINYTPSNPQEGDKFKSKTSNVIITLTLLGDDEKKEGDKVYDYRTDQDIYGIPNGENKKITKEHLQMCFEPVLTDQQQQILQVFSELGVDINTLFPSIHNIFEISPEKADQFRYNLAILKECYDKGLISIKGSYKTHFYFPQSNHGTSFINILPLHRDQKYQPQKPVLTIIVAGRNNTFEVSEGELENEDISIFSRELITYNGREFKS